MTTDAILHCAIHLEHHVLSLLPKWTIKSVLVSTLTAPPVTQLSTMNVS